MAKAFSLPWAARAAAPILSACALNACGGGGSLLPQTFTVGGTVAGLASGESVVITNNTTDSLTVNGNTSFQFATPIQQGGGYSVKVATAPAGQSCVVSNGSGSNVTANVTNVTVACSSLAQYAYVLNNTDQSVSQYSISTNGTLTPLSPATVATGNSPQSVTIDPTHRYVYVTNLTDDTISQYVIQSGGALAPNASPTVSTGHSPWALSIDPQGKFAYVVNSVDATVAQYSIDSTGALEALATTPVATGAVPWNITISANGKFAYVSNHGASPSGGTTVSQYSIAPDTGALAPLNPATAATGTYPGGSAVDATSAFAYVTNVGDGTVSQYSIGAGGELANLTPATVNAGSQPDFIAIDPGNRYAYVANFTPGVPPAAAPSGSVSQYALGANGQLTPLATPAVATGVGPQWVAFDPFGRFVYVANMDGTVSEYSIGADGALAPLGVVAVGHNAFAIATTYVTSP